MSTRPVRRVNVSLLSTLILEGQGRTGGCRRSPTCAGACGARWKSAPWTEPQRLWSKRIHKQAVRRQTRTANQLCQPEYTAYFMLGFFYIKYTYFFALFWAGQLLSWAFNFCSIWLGFTPLFSFSLAYFIC